MKKIIKTFIIVLLILVINLLIGCNKKLIKLDTPKVNITQNRVIINNVDNASGYKLYINGEVKEVITITFYDLDLPYGTYAIEVCAVGDNVMYQDSDKSDVCLYKHIDKIIIEDKNEVIYNMLENGSYQYNGLINEIIDFDIEHQMKDLEMWRHEENRLVSDFDNEMGFTGEYWGKTLRGACLAYEYNHDEELYQILENSVRKILNKQEESGRISSYDVEHEFTGWDLWCRGYVLKGMQYFYNICKDDSLKTDLIKSQIAQVDYIMKYIGKGKKEILLATNDWGGLNSCNILEPICNLYQMTKESKYLEFAKYIVDTGGSTMLSSSGKTLYQDALSKTAIYKFGCRKLYELMNYFDGVLQYYLVTNDSEALMAAKNVYYLISETEITEIGAAATDVEEANNAVIEQANPDNIGRMQETCVLTVLSRLSSRIYSLTGDVKIIDNLEKEYYNAIVGITNWEMCSGFVAFSYSPCSTTARQSVYSGCAPMEDGTFQSCCIANALFGACQFTRMATLTNSQNKLLFNLYFPGSGEAILSNQTKVKFITETNYPVDDNINIKLSLEKNEQFTISLRIPSWSKQTKVIINGNEIEGVKNGEYLDITKDWKNGDEITLIMDMRAYLIWGSEKCSNENAKYNVVVKRGPLVFARDSRIESNVFKPLDFYVNEDGYLDAELIELPFKSQTGLKVKLKDNTYAVLADYGSCGKTESNESIMSLWIPTVDYSSCILEEKFVMLSNYDSSPISYNFQTNRFETNKEFVGVGDVNNVAKLSFVMEKASNGKYFIYSYEAKGYLTVTDNGEISVAAKDENNEKQLFEIERVSLTTYLIKCYNESLLSLNNDGFNNVYTYPDVKHIKQEWILKNTSK